MLQTVPDPGNGHVESAMGTSMPIASGRPVEVDDLLERARSLTPDEIHALAAGYLSLLFDAELAAADAALVALLPERFSDEVAAQIAGPWRRVACG
jgi:hypothetical protein